MATELVADRTLDCTGMLCPVPIVKLSKAIKEIQPGQTILLLATDPGSQPDMAAWQRRTKNEVTVMEPHGKTFRFFIRRTA
jgi:tRNA 2-thiouridine synthesizing protein A